MKTLKMDGESINSQETLLGLLKQCAPEIFSDGKIDAKQLRATLGEDVMADSERYGLSWAGKTDCFRTIQETTASTLKPARAESVNFDETENIFIEGDNLEVLKVLQKSYYGKVKMIYIDPPYNTGHDFVYNDKFSRNKREYLEEVGAIDGAGNVVNAGLYSLNTKDSGHYHSDWLNMMYPRLFLAKNLLRQDGVIFVSIDDNEVSNLRTVMNEIFGEENFVATFVWQSKKGGGSDKGSAVTDHEYVICFAKTLEGVDLARIEINSEPLNLLDSKGAYRRGRELNKWGSNSRREDRPTMFFSVLGPNGVEVFPIRNDGTEGRWRWGKKRMMEIVASGNAEFVERDPGLFVVYEKIRTTDPRSKPHRTWMNGIGETTADGSKVVKELFDGQKLFDFPKPIELISNLLRIGSAEDDDIFLDFFAGSATTAHAVMQLNAEDGGNRKWICVQLPEKCKPDTEAAKAGFVTISDIAKERIRRAGKKILTENPGSAVDVGFKAFKLDESNFKIWNTNVTSVEQLEQQMIEMFDNVRDGSTKEAMAYELILKTGNELNVAIEKKETGGEAFLVLGDGSIVICLADKLNMNLFMGIIAGKPKKIIVLDKSFGDDDQLKTNLLLRAEAHGIDEVRVI